MPVAPLLLLFSRRGCCLCEGLEERLRDLGDHPLPPLQVVDVDQDPELLRRYDLSVPVLALASGDGVWRELPRVPPRLAGSRLADWLRLHGVGGTVSGAAAAGEDSRHSGAGAPGCST